MKKLLTMGVVALTACAWAAPGEGRQESFLLNQAMGEMQRISGQVDVVQANCDALERRVTNIENGKGDLGSVKRDIESLRHDVASLRNEMVSLREEITSDLTKKIASLMKSAAPAPAPAPAPRTPPTNCRSYKVQSGDTLSLVAQAFKTTVREIRSLNNLKSDNLRIGQELLVPAPRR